MKKFTPFNPLSVQSFSGFDLSLKMSMNYLSRYLKGWRELEFISEYYYLLKDYIDSSSLFEMHHIYNNNDYLLVKMYPLKRLLKDFKKHQLKNILDVDLNKAYLKYIDKSLFKIENQNKELMNKISTLKKIEINKLVLRIPHNSPSLNLYDKYSKSLCISKKEFIRLSNYNSDPLLTRLVNGKRFSYMALSDTSRLFFDLERLIGNDGKEDVQGFSFMPKYAISPDKEDPVKIRNYDYLFQDPNYFTFLNLWTNFNSAFEEKVKELKIKNKCRRIFVISLHSFSESYIYKKFPYTSRKCPDINIVLSNKIGDATKQKIKRKIYYLDHKFKIKASFSFPYNDTYELLNASISNAFCITIEINKKIYLDDIYNPKIRDDITSIKKYLDEFLLYLLRFK